MYPQETVEPRNNKIFTLFEVKGESFRDLREEKKLEKAR